MIHHQPLLARPPFAVRKHRQTISLLVVAVTAGLFFLAAYRPGTLRLESVRAEVQRLNEEISANSVKLASLTSIHQEVLALRKQTSIFGKCVPGEHALGEFLRDLSMILERNGLENHIFQPRPSHAVGLECVPPGTEGVCANIQVQPVLVQCDGHFGGLFASLRDIERLARLSQVDTLKVSADPDHPGHLKAELLINTYFRAAAPTAKTGGR